ncbi:hypothetical protein ACFLWS_02560 [Chloroflexota bacterium]
MFFQAGGTEGTWVERFFLDFRRLKCMVADDNEAIVICILKDAPSHPWRFLRKRAIA